MPVRDARYPVPEEASMLPVFRALAACHQRTDRAFVQFLEARGLTPSQFDVLAVLGDTEGMPCKELSRRSLVTGGTLNPVLNRMEARGLVQRGKSEVDSRQTIVRLTPEGQALYEQTFLPLIDHFRSTYLATLTPGEQDDLVRLLGKLEAALA